MFKIFFTLSSSILFSYLLGQWYALNSSFEINALETHPRLLKTNQSSIISCSDATAAPGRSLGTCRSCKYDATERKQIWKGDEEEVHL